MLTLKGDLWVQWECSRQQRAVLVRHQALKLLSFALLPTQPFTRCAQPATAPHLCSRQQRAVLVLHQALKLSDLVALELAVQLHQAAVLVLWPNV